MNNYFEVEHENKTHTLIRADSRGQAKRILIQMGFSLEDVVSIVPMPKEGESA